MRARIPLAVLLVVISIALAALFTAIYFLLLSRDQGWPTGALAFLAASTVFLLWSVVLWRRPAGATVDPAGSENQSPAEEVGTGGSGETTNRVMTDSNKGKVVQGRDIGRISTSIFNAPVTLITLFPTVDRHSARGVTALLAVLVFVSAAVLVVIPSVSGPADEAQATDAQAAAGTDRPTSTEESGETAGDADEDEDDASEKISCEPTGREGATLEAPSPAAVDVLPVVCHRSAFLAPSFVFPAEDGFPEVPEIPPGDFSGLDVWIEREGFKSYPEWAYANGAVDANTSAVSFAVTSESGEAIDILKVDISVVSSSDPIEGYYLPPFGAGPLDVRMLEFDLDDPSAPPVRTGHDMGTNEWNFPLSVRDVEGASESDRREVFSVVGSTTQSTVEWVVTVHLLVDNQAEKVVVDNTGKPFVTTASSASEEIGFRIES